jgi:hypothetical protein
LNASKAIHAQVEFENLALKAFRFDYKPGHAAPKASTTFISSSCWLSRKNCGRVFTKRVYNAGRSLRFQAAAE